MSCRFGKMSVEDSSYIAKSQITNVVIKNSTVISENEGIPQKDIAVLLLYCPNIRRKLSLAGFAAHFSIARQKQQILRFHIFQGFH